MCDVWCVCLCVFPSGCPCTHLLTCLFIREWAFIFAGPFKTFQNLACSNTTYLYNRLSMSLHISLFKQCLTDRASPKKCQVFLCISFVFLEFWNHMYITVQGLTYITITASFPTKWKLKEYGCRRSRVIHWWNDLGIWSDLFCTKRSQEERGFFSQKMLLQNLEPIASQPHSTKYFFFLNSTLW